MATATFDKSIDILTAVKNVEAAVEKVINDADQNFPEAATIGDAVRQGDVYIQLIEPLTEPPPFYSKIANPVFPFQLAPGNTKGSRHMLEGSAGLELYACDASKFDAENADMDDKFFDNRRKFEAKIENYTRKITGESEIEARGWQSKSRNVSAEILAALALSGPIMVVKTKTKVSHPEHGDWILPPGTYRVVFQRTIDSTMRVQRVFD